MIKSRKNPAIRKALKFDVFTQSMKYWDPPHQGERISADQIGELILKAEAYLKDEPAALLFRDREKYVNEYEKVSRLKSLLEMACKSPDERERAKAEEEISGFERRWLFTHFISLKFKFIMSLNPLEFQRLYDLIGRVRPNLLGDVTETGIKSPDKDVSEMAKKVLCSSEKHDCRNNQLLP